MCIDYFPTGMGLKGQGLTIKTLRVKRDSSSRDPQGGFS
jgi:hypothetical protein